MQSGSLVAQGQIVVKKKNARPENIFPRRRDEIGMGVDARLRLSAHVWYTKVKFPAWNVYPCPLLPNHT
jgi:hypothetical protein